MRKRPYYLFSALLLLPFLRAVAGGWATVTVDQLPDHLVARQPSTLSFMVRQHGRTPLKGVHPELLARSGDKTVRGAVVPGRADGEYLASYTIPSAGEWTLTIESGWGASKLTLLPIRAIEPGSPVPVALAGADLGRHLFVAKGCVGCHMRREAELDQGAEVGPPLTGKRYAAVWLQRFLADPSIPDRPKSGSFVMPNLGLRPGEIAALVAFLNGDSKASF